MRVARCPLLAALACCLAAPALAAPEPYTVTASIPGDDGGWDYASVDAASGRFFTAHGDTVGTVDLAHPDRVRALGEAHHAHAVLPLPGGKDLLVTDGDTATVRFVDQRSGATRATVTVGEKPDAAIWDARRKQAVVMSARGGSVEFIDPATAKVKASVPLAPFLESAAFDSKGLLFVNNEKLNAIHVVDVVQARAVGTIALTGCVKPTGMAYAPRANRIVVACANGVAAIVDPEQRALVGTLPIGPGPDAVIADPAHGRLLIPSGGDGTLAVLADRPGGIAKLASVTTEMGARTGAVDPRSGKVYLPTARLGEPDKPGGRGQPLPGSFHILVLSPKVGA
jgi:hypothetical protein